MKQILHVLSIFFLFLFVASQAQAQEIEIPAGLEYRCLNIERCQTSGTCSTDHVHRVRLTKTSEFATAPATSDAFVTECLQVVEAGQNQPTTICTTGDAALDQELWGAGTGAAQYLARLAASPISYSLNHDAGDGIFTQNPATNQFENTGPTKVSLSQTGIMSPSAIEWQSYTQSSFDRKYLVWRKIPQSAQAATGTDSGQKQGTLTWDTLEGQCQGEAWDPKGVVFDAETGMPINDVDLAVQYSANSAGPFAAALAGIGEVLPPGTLPLRSQLAGLYSFFGISGHYVIQPTSTAFNHASQAVKIPSAVAAIYKSSLNYYADSAPIFEQAGKLKIQNIPMISKIGVAKPPFMFKILSQNSRPTADGKLLMDGQVNAPSTLIVEICAYPNGIPNCRDKKSYAPGKGGPTASTDFRYSITLDQSVLRNGETYLLSFTPFSVTAPQAHIPSFFTKIFQTLSHFVPQVMAQESNTIQMKVEPIPTYIEGYAYDDAGQTIPGALVSIYVSFSPAPFYSTRANEMGYFQITSNHLPQDAYTIRFTNPNGDATTSLSTSAFLAQNNEFMLVEKVNPFVRVTEQTNPRANVTPAFLPRSAEVGINQQESTQKPQENSVSPTMEKQESAPTQAQSPNTVALLGMIFLALIGVTVAVVLYMKMKKQRDSGNMS